MNLFYSLYFYYYISNIYGGEIVHTLKTTNPRISVDMTSPEVKHFGINALPPPLTVLSCLRPIGRWRCKSPRRGRLAPFYPRFTHTDSGFTYKWRRVGADTTVSC